MESGFGPFYLFRGTVGRLTCNPRAAPRATKDQYKWYKGTTLLTSSPPYRIEHGEFSTLIIDNVDKNRDEGLYKCYAENFLGNSEATATATVFGEKVMHICLLNKRALDMVQSPCPGLDCTLTPQVQFHLWRRLVQYEYDSKISSRSNSFFRYRNTETKNMEYLGSTLFRS